MKFARAIDDYVADMRSQGRISTQTRNTEDVYRRVLGRHCDDVSGRDPALTGRDDVKRTLNRWPHPNSRRQAHAVLRSFYDWCEEEGIRDTNPARQVRRAKSRQVAVYRPTREEVVRLCHATEGHRRERWVIYLGVLAGLRRQELCLLQDRHFARDGFVWVSQDIGKGGRERWIPVLPELVPIVAEIQLLVGPGCFVFPSRRSVNPPLHTEQRDTDKPISSTGMYKLVKRVGQRAHLGAEIGPHTLRHAFGDHVARHSGLKVAQALMGHASSATTESAYTNRPTLDELVVASHGFAYGLDDTAKPRSTPQSSHNVDTGDAAPRRDSPEKE